VAAAKMPLEEAELEAGTQQNLSNPDFLLIPMPSILFKFFGAKLKLDVYCSNVFPGKV
jgi:hypothetical protein